jgi:hypothetical protein
MAVLAAAKGLKVGLVTLFVQGGVELGLLAGRCKAVIDDEIYAASRAAMDGPAIRAE